MQRWGCLIFLCFGFIKTSALSTENSSRRDLLIKAPLGVAGAYGYARLLKNALAVRGIQYPDEHERRIAETIRTALGLQATTKRRPLRILEVGIGKDCRVIRRGLYHQGLQQLGDDASVHIMGVDLTAPKADIVESARRKLQESAPSTQLVTQAGDLCAGLSFEDGEFDCVLCFLTLCSVADPRKAVEELRRLVRPNGGTLGYVEHVQATEEESRFFQWQQNVLDPLQQLVADNCHLTRTTQQTIDGVFQTGSQTGSQSTLVSSQRFFVDTMWPVCCQCSGVVQRNVG